MYYLTHNFISVSYVCCFSDIMAVTMKTEVKEECLSMDVKVELTEGDTPLELKLDAQADGCIKG